ncbi:PAS domain-containing protein [bacterium]|nr:PAS domain-containing protein [bacterium]
MVNDTIAANFKQAHWFRALWETSGNLLFVLDGQGRILESNTIAETVLNPTPNTDLAILFHEKETMAHAVKQCLEQNKLVKVASITLSQGQYANSTTSLHVFPIEEAEGKRIFVIGNSVSNNLDLLEETAKRNDARLQKLSDQLTTVSNELLVKTLQLAEEKNKLSTVINGISEGLLGCDEEGHIIHSNQTAQELLKIPVEDIGNKTFDEICPDIAADMGFVKNEPDNIVKQRLDLRIEEKDIQIIVSPIFDEEQNAIGFVLILHDRTKEAELDRMKSDLISIVSHELRSPLTSIKGYVDLMIGGDLGDIPESMKSYLQIVSVNANRLSALIDDMLDLSRIESGKLNMSFGKVDVKYLCDYVFLTMKPQAQQKSIAFSQQVPQGLAVSGDVDRLQQVVTNLVSNAIKYTMPEGTVTIEAERGHGTVRIAVRDDGVGIREEDQKKLFQKFFRVKDDNTRNIGGTGLGLCIAKSIVEAHNGIIEVVSQKGKGSCFTMELPEYHP